MTNNYPRPQLRPGQLRIKDQDICQVVPGEGSFENPGGSGGQYSLYHKDQRAQNLHIQHYTKRQERNRQKIINRLISEVDRGQSNQSQAKGPTGHIKPYG